MPSYTFCFTNTIGILLIVWMTITQIHVAQSQYSEGTPKYEQKQHLNENALREQIQILEQHQNQNHDSKPDPDPIVIVAPNKYKLHKPFENVLGYRLSIPHTQDYNIGLLINPCGVNSTFSFSRKGQIKWNKNKRIWEPYPLGYDCCMHVFGHGEYGHLTKEAIQQQNPYPSYRIGKSDFPILAQPHEVLHNINLVDEHGNPILPAESRRADDFVEIDETCVGLRDPLPYCLLEGFRAVKNSLMPTCMDYNATVDSTLNCFTPKGKLFPNCMQIGYGQTAFIHICEQESQNDPHCGTFLEIHLPNGSRYDSEETVLSETKLTTRITNGMVTTTLPLLYKNNPNRILCDYRETTLRIGTMVIINDQAPVCCCPRAYTKKKKLGSFFCPKKPKTRYGGGPFADAVDTIQELVDRDSYNQKYPYCPLLNEETQDALMCSKQSSVFTEDRYNGETGIAETQGRFYTYPCSEITYHEETNTYMSPDLEGYYNHGKCTHGEAFQSCGILQSSQSKCFGQDFLFTFTGELGKIISIPSDVSNANTNTPLYQQQYGVTFNDGRTVYYFYPHQIDPLHEDNTNINSYEIWYVQRTQRERVIQKKKAFRVLNPRCTYDSTNGIYFPFAQLDENGNWMEIYSEYDGVVEARDYVLDTMEGVK